MQLFDKLLESNIIETQNDIMCIPECHKRGAIWKFLLKKPKRVMRKLLFKL